MKTLEKSVTVLFVQDRRIVKQSYHGKIKFYGKFQREIVKLYENSKN